METTRQARWKHKQYLGFRCIDCGVRLDDRSRWLCNRHLDLQNARVRRYRNKKRKKWKSTIKSRNQE